MSATLPVYDMKGKQTEKLELTKGIFDKEVNPAVLYQASIMYQANKRQGTASTKTRGEVSGGGRKPWRQKGTGRARAGSIRSPLWRGGGIVFGPHPREFNYAIPRKMKLLALKSSLNAKLSADEIILVEGLEFETSKTKEVATFLDKLGIKEKSLMIIDKDKEKNNGLLRICRNIPHFDLISAQEVNAYDILRNKKLIITKLALKALTHRLRI